jgi:hypothetical protein
MPVAIIAAGALIGLGLFFGLRSQTAGPALPADAASPTTSPVTAPASALLPLPTPPEPPRPGPATAAAVDTKAVAASLKLALDQHKKMIVEQCLNPSLAKKAEPKTVKLSFNFSLDASGKQVARGVSEDRATSRPEVTQCIQEKLPGLSVAPPGASVFVDGIEWVLP